MERARVQVQARVMDELGNNTLRAPGLFWSQYWRSIIVFGGNTYGASKTSSQLAIWQFKVGAVATGDGNWTETRGPDNELWKAVLWPYSAAYASGSPAGFVLGGSDPNFFNNEATDLQNVYILSLPAFRWFKTPVVVPARAGANCHVVRNQMLTYGGWDPTTSSSYASADSWTYGLGIFDTSSLTWGTAFNGSAEVYGTPEVVKRWYAGNSKYPTWNDPDTAALFTTLRAAATSSSPTSTPTPSSTSGLSAPLPSLPADSKTNVGAIAGGVVGGVAVLAAVAFLLWFFCMRGKKEKGEKGEGIPELHNQRDVPEMVGEGRPFLEMDAGGERRGAYEVDGREKGGVDVKDVKRVELEPVELA
ncbi:hypothetical protein M7I_2041 [Glarea lozoyensis 74030]|uniref:Kelch repeat-containing protein n=1 Tax=Glarea lozoyensis (strain ATCC 74030 / MF5533) TaxID=1104152 RepID=H0EHQ7_GLAL7|nr:hypothetical protein M7I_2041 [Glarea lozoyensis 74030]